MQLPQVVLAVVCVLLGVVPSLGLGLLARALASSQQGFGVALAQAPPIASRALFGISEFNSTAVFAPFAIALVLGMTFVAAYALSKMGGSRRRAAVPWLCGYARDAEVYRYTAHNFYGEIKRYFRWLGGAPRPERDKRPALKERLT
jgi:hypothetical protein